MTCLEEYQFRFFTDEQERRDLKEAIENIIRETRNRQINTIIVFGASGQPVASLFKEAWSVLHPREEVPKFYALGLLYQKQKLRDLFRGGKGLEQLHSFLEKRIPSLVDRKNEKMLLLDDFAETGSTIRRVKERFSTLGFRDITTAALFASSPEHVDFVGRIRSLRDFPLKRGPSFYDQRLPAIYNLKLLQGIRILGGRNRDEARRAVSSERRKFFNKRDLIRHELKRIAREAK